MEALRASIDKLSHDGRGIAHIQGKTTFVFGALPGEEVSFCYIKKKAKFDEAKMLSVEKASPHRVTPVCNFFGLCGGCNLQHIDQNMQIAFKQEMLIEQLKHFGKVEPRFLLKPLHANPYGYRRKARFSARYVNKKQKMLVGFRELHNPRYLAEIDSCQVLDPAIGLMIASLQECISNLDNRHHIAQIEVAKGDDACALIIRHLQPLTGHDLGELKGFAEQQKIWLFLQPGGQNSIYKLYPSDDAIFLSYEINDNIKLYFHPSDFTQVNAQINRQMISQALDLLDLKANDVVLDLFCGLGNFSLPIASRCKKVLGVEGEDKLVKRAAMNAERNNISNAVFFTADLNHPQTLENISPEVIYNKILIDPPRSGAKNVVEHINLEKVETIVYVSCNPSTLARDAGILAQRGFELESVGVMDMFTHTEHVEAMASFKRI